MGRIAKEKTAEEAVSENGPQQTAESETQAENTGDKPALTEQEVSDAMAELEKGWAELEEAKREFLSNVDTTRTEMEEQRRIFNASVEAFNADVAQFNSANQSAREKSKTASSGGNRLVVIQQFNDKQDIRKVYTVGSDISHVDEKRAQELINKKLAEWQ